MVPSETWVEKKEWEKIRNNFPKGYTWEAQFAKKEHKKGRAIGGLVMGVRKELVEEKKEKKENQEEGMIVGEMKVIGEKWAIIGLYVNGNMERKMKRSERKNRGGRWRLLGRKGEG